MDVYLGLFFTAFLSATLLPGASEITLIALMQQDYNMLMLWVFATTGNTLGAVVNYFMGKYLLYFENKKWFPFKKEKLQHSQRWFQRYGAWSMLFAWMPIVGDGLTFIAGMMKMNFLLFIGLVAIGKGARYAVLLGVLNSL